MTNRGEQNKYLINITSIKYKLPTTRAIFEQIFSKLLMKIQIRSELNGDPFDKTSICLQDIFKYKKDFLVTTLNRLQKPSLGILCGLSLLYTNNEQKYHWFLLFSIVDHVEKVMDYLFPTQYFPQRKKFFVKKKILLLIFTKKEPQWRIYQQLHIQNP